MAVVVGVHMAKRDIDPKHAECAETSGNSGGEEAAKGKGMPRKRHQLNRYPLAGKSNKSTTFSCYSTQIIFR